MNARIVMVLGSMLGLLVGCKGGGKPAEPEQEAAEQHEGATDHLRLTPEQVKTAAIASAPAEERAETAPIEVTATIEPAADRQARVGSRIPGRVVGLKAKVGDRVRAGQVLAVVDSPELGRAKADYLATAAAADLARQNSDRKRALFDDRITAEKEWREAEADATRTRAEKDAAEARLHALGVTDDELPHMRKDGHLESAMAVVSPIGGLVVEASATLGQMVAPENTLFVVMDISEVWLQVDAYEQDLPQLRRGQRAAVRLKAVPSEAFQGTVDDVGAVVDPKSRTVKVRVVLANPRGELKPGMFATVTIEGTAGERRRGLYVPSGAVQRLGREHVVFVVKGEAEFEPRKVEIAAGGKDWVEVRRGLDAGERVVTQGAFALKSELKKDELGGEE